MAERKKTLTAKQIKFFGTKAQKAALKKKGGSIMAKKGHYHKRGFSLPLAAILGFAPVFTHAWSAFQSGGLNSAANVASQELTGYSPMTRKWQPMAMARGLMPIILGIMVHKFIGGRLGVNRALAGAGVPIIRL